MLAARVADVNRHYPIPMMKPEHVAIVALVTSAFGIYRRNFARERDKAEQAPQAPPVAGDPGDIPDNVTAFPVSPWLAPGVLAPDHGA